MSDIDYNVILKEYNDKLYDENVGLTSDDYIELTKLLKDVKGELNQENNEYYEEIRSLLYMLLRSGVATGLSYENYEYVLNELSPLPFVFANRELQAPPKSHEYFRATQFKFYHLKKAKKDTKGHVLLLKNNRVQKIEYDKGQKVSFESLSNIEYIMQQEKITFKEAILVLLGVYNCNNSIRNEKLKEIIERYKEVLGSDKYLEFLFGAVDRAKENKTYNKEALDFYIKRCDEYLLVKRHKTNPNYKYQSVPKALILKRK